MRLQDLLGTCRRTGAGAEKSYEEQGMHASVRTFCTERGMAWRGDHGKQGEVLFDESENAEKRAARGGEEQM